jgi:transcription factor SPN1
VIILRGRKSGPGGSSRQYTTRPEASALDYMIRPQSKVDPEEIRARAKQNLPDPRRQKVGLFSIHFLISTYHIT